MTYTQRAGTVQLAEGKKVAVALGLDVDAMAIWDGSFHRWTPAYQSRGEFGVEVAVPRLLRLLDKHQVKATWCIPGHTADTWPQACKDIAAAGHEIAHHGYMHENPTEVDEKREREVLLKGIDSLQRITNNRPRGYRSPYWDFSPNTLDLLEELEFTWDSSLMANDLHPYYPRKVIQAEWVQHGTHEVGWGPSTFSDPSPVLEIPVSWYLDDFPAEEYVTGIQEGMNPVDDIQSRWQSIYEYAATQEEGAVYALTTHPQTIGRPHMIQMLERLLVHMKDNGAQFMSLSEVADATVFAK
jgi:peptidoglycan/xylan/chitin deacetylase (PgdA/CDA1 family)